MAQGDGDRREDRDSRGEVAPGLATGTRGGWGALTPPARRHPGSGMKMMSSRSRLTSGSRGGGSRGGHSPTVGAEAQRAAVGKETPSVGGGLGAGMGVSGPSEGPGPVWGSQCHCPAAPRYCEPIPTHPKESAPQAPPLVLAGGEPCRTNPGGGLWGEPKPHEAPGSSRGGGGGCVWLEPLGRGPAPLWGGKCPFWGASGAGVGAAGGRLAKPLQVLPGSRRPTPGGSRVANGGGGGIKVRLGLPPRGKMGPLLLLLLLLLLPPPLPGVLAAPRPPQSLPGVGAACRHRPSLPMPPAKSGGACGVGGLAAHPGRSSCACRRKGEGVRWGGGSVVLGDPSDPLYPPPPSRVLSPPQEPPGATASATLLPASPHQGALPASLGTPPRTP